MTEPQPTPPYGSDVLPDADRPTPRRTWLPVASAGAVLAVVVAALVLTLGRTSPGRDAVTDAAALVHAASSRAAQAGSSDVAVDVTVSVAGRTVTGTGSGSFDYRRHVGQLTLDMTGVGETHELVTPTAMYMRFPDTMNGVVTTTARPWLMISFADFKSRGVDLSRLMSQNNGGDPSAMLRVLSKATDVHQVGTDTVDGARTTHYTADVGFLDLLRAEGATDAVDLSKLPPGTASTMYHVGVWLDKTGLTRRLSMAMTNGAFGNGSMTMTMTFRHFGVPVTVVAPPPSIVTDLSALLGRSHG